MYDQTTSSMMAFLSAYIIIFLIIAIINIIALWKLFTLAKKPGWAAIIPIYNVYIMLEISGLPWWWLLVLIFGGIIPVIGIFIVIAVGFYIILKFVQSYGKGVGFAIGAYLLSFIFMPILAFSKDTQYVGPAAAQGQTQQSETEPQHIEQSVEETEEQTTEEATDTSEEETKNEE